MIVVCEGEGIKMTFVVSGNHEVKAFDRKRYLIWLNLIFTSIVDVFNSLQDELWSCQSSHNAGNKCSILSNHAIGAKNKYSACSDGNIWTSINMSSMWTNKMSVFRVCYLGESASAQLWQPSEQAITVWYYVWQEIMFNHSHTGIVKKEDNKEENIQWYKKVI